MVVTTPHFSQILDDACRGRENCDSTAASCSLVAPAKVRTTCPEKTEPVLVANSSLFLLLPPLLTLLPLLLTLLPLPCTTSTFKGEFRESKRLRDRIAARKKTTVSVSFALVVMIHERHAQWKLHSVLLTRNTVPVVVLLV